MARAQCLYVTASLFLLMATLACGISFFAPYWLGNVTKPSMTVSSSVEAINVPYIVVPESVGTDNNSSSEAAVLTGRDYVWRGLWAQCAGVCQWFWQHDYKLQYKKFNPLRWHLATQVLYFVGAFLVLFCEIFSRVQLCCRQRHSIYRAIGFLLLASFVIQAAAVAVFGGFANRDYGATASVTDEHTYLGWSFWMAVAGGGATLIAGVVFLLMDWVADLDDDDDYTDK